MKYWNQFLIIVLFCGSLIGCTPEERPNTPAPSDKVMVEDFEKGSKSSYAAAEVNLTTGTWTLDGALIGSSDNDKKKGNKALRMQEGGKASTNFSVKAKSITISHAQYGSGESSAWELWISDNQGRTWKKAGSTVNTNNASLNSITFNINAEVFLEIRQVAGPGRLNLDDITIQIGEVTSGGTTGGTTGGNTGTPGRDDHLTLGNPSNATTSTSNKDNFLMVKDQFVLSYNDSRGTANWVSWHLSSAWKGTAERKDDFRADDALPAGFNRVIPTDYTNTGFDRGHLCPSDDRDGSQDDNSMTFLMTNMIPQAPNNNRQTWRFLEEYARKLVEGGNEMYIIAGAYGTGGSGSNGGTTNRISGKVTVPARTWKVIVVLQNGSNDLSRITSSTRVIAVDMPNTQSVSDKSWGDYRVSVDAIEKATGLDLLNKVPKSVQDALEAKTDNGATE